MRCCLVGLAALIAAPAMAQAPQSGFRSSLEAATLPCLIAHGDAASTSEKGIQICQKTAVSINDLLTANPTVSQADRNSAYQYRAFAESQIALYYVRIDIVRSARVCVQQEAVWATLHLIVDSASPEDDRADFTSMRTSSAKVLRLCRQEKGTPPGAAPLPPA